MSAALPEKRGTAPKLDAVYYGRLCDQLLTHVEVVRHLVYLCMHKHCDEQEKRSYMEISEQELGRMVDLLRTASTRS